MNSSRAFFGEPGMNQVASRTATSLEGSTRNSVGDSTKGTFDVDRALIVTGRVKRVKSLSDLKVRIRKLEAMMMM
jgi:hypothetical protein